MTSNEHDISQVQKVFRNVKCNVRGDALKDVVESLRAAHEISDISKRASARILQTNSSHDGPVDDCDALIKNILVFCKEIIDMRKSGNTKGVQEHLSWLKFDLDFVDRSEWQTEARLRDLFENVTESLQHDLRKLELEEQRNETYQEQLALKLVIQNLQKGHVDFAWNTFKELQVADLMGYLVVEDFLLSAYSDSKVGLQQLVPFVCKIENLVTTYTVIKDLFNKMSENNQLENKETTLMYLRLQFLVTDAKFESKETGLKSNILELKSKLATHTDKILTSLVNEIQSGAFDRAKKLVEIAGESEELLLNDLMKLYLSKTNLNEFMQLYNFVHSLPLFASMCYAHSAIWQELRATGSGDTMEALAVWMHASEITKDQNMSDARCMKIANVRIPKHKLTRISNYKTYLESSAGNEIAKLHKLYNMNYIFTDYINSLNLTDFNEFSGLVEVINKLPTFDQCISVAAIYEKFKASPQMLGSFQHFQILQIVKEARAHPNYSSMDKFARSKCESVTRNTPYLFNKVLFQNTKNCKLINRVYEEPLYFSELHDVVYREIDTWIPKTDAANQYWNLGLQGQTVSLVNNFYNTYKLAFLNGTLRGYDIITRENNLRFQTTKDDFFMLEAGKFTKSLCQNRAFVIL